jgi:hypothetical protein
MLSEKKIFEISENLPNKTKTTNKIEDYASSQIQQLGNKGHSTDIC